MALNGEHVGDPQVNRIREVDLDEAGQLSPFPLGHEAGEGGPQSGISVDVRIGDE